MVIRALIWKTMMKVNIEISNSIEAMNHEVEKRIKHFCFHCLEPKVQFILCKQRVFRRQPFQKKWSQPISLTL